MQLAFRIFMPGGLKAAVQRCALFTLRANWKKRDEIDVLVENVDGVDEDAFKHEVATALTDAMLDQQRAEALVSEGLGGLGRRCVWHRYHGALLRTLGPRICSFQTKGQSPLGRRQQPAFTRCTGTPGRCGLR